MNNKSTVEEIRDRFDHDVERFSNLETGQVAAIDSPLHLELIAEAAVVTTPDAMHMLDIGCGAGNYTLKLLAQYGRRDVEVSLIDLSQPMLDRAVQRVGEQTDAPIHAMQSDIRAADLGEARYDVIVAAQCLHHLRTDSEWQDVFTRIFKSLRPGGSFWVADSVTHELPGVEAAMKQRWGTYLQELQGTDYRDHVQAYVEKEDTPRPLTEQLDRLRSVGFSMVEVLHKHNRFASFGALKSC